MEKKCPFCGAETRPGDNFCLNCGNRLLPATPAASFQQTQPSSGEATIAAPDNWGASIPLAPVSASGSNWSDIGGATIAANSGSLEPTPYQEPAPTATAQATAARIEQPARFLLHSEAGEILQEYPLDKAEITIGRAPNSDILLSKDKLTSRRHATVHFENNQYTLRDERSANGTFVNGQQLEEVTPHVLQDGDHVGIGEHELIFRAFGTNNVEDLPTIAVPLDQVPVIEATARTRADELATVSNVTTSDDYGTKDMGDFSPAPVPVAPSPEPVLSMSNGFVPSPPTPTPSTPLPVVSSSPTVQPDALNVPDHLVNLDKPARSGGSTASVSQEASSPADQAGQANQKEGNVTLGTITSLRHPSLPVMTDLMAALSALDGQVVSLQEQLNATQEAVHNHETEIAQATNQIRTNLRSVCERMDSTIASVARNREALDWGELQQLVEDVMNARDYELVAKLARKARDLNKVFQIHQGVLNTMAECNSLLRSMIGDDRP